MNQKQRMPFLRRTAFTAGSALIAGMAILSGVSGCGGNSSTPSAADIPQSSSQVSTTASDSEPTGDPVSTDTANDSANNSAGTEESQLPSESQAPPSTANKTSVSPSHQDPGDPARPTVPQRYRLPDDRPVLNADELLSHGLRIVESKHLVLVTDLPPESVAELPPLAEALFVTLEQRLGKLAPNIAGTDFKVTAFLMDARERFQDAGVLPPEEFTIRHGRHLGYQLWVNNQPTDYYRRHLLLHEFVHCFMMCEYGMNEIPPLWYTEGIAEYFATHQLKSDITQSEFGILPSSTAGFEGWHRIAEVRRHFNPQPSSSGELAGVIPLQSVMDPPDTTFVEDSQYANAWALVWLINHHPELQPEFAALASCRTLEQFNDVIAGIPEPILQQMNQIWPLYLHGLEEAAASTVRFPTLAPPPRPAASSEHTLPQEFKLEAGEQWVSTGYELAAGQRILIECSGRYVVRETTKPWISEPNGITIDYVHGRPLGEVIGVIVSSDGTESTRHIPIGASKILQSPIDGILWLQVNDQWSDRTNNNGTVSVRISNAPQ